MRFFRILALAVLTALAAGVVHAQMYKWVDENGRVQYTQTPPPGKKAEVIQSQKKAPAAAEAPAVAKDSKGKAQARQPVEVDDGVHRDVKRMAGDWSTRLGDPVQIRFYVKAGAPAFLLSHSWAVSGKTSIGNDKRFVIDGVEGRGILTAVDGGEGQDAALPASFRYQLQGDLHRLRRPETK
jgi:hypothetical protein